MNEGRNNQEAEKEGRKSQVKGLEGQPVEQGGRAGFHPLQIPSAQFTFPEQW
jgi:hypothetical protein